MQTLKDGNYRGGFKTHEGQNRKTYQLVFTKRKNGGEAAG